MLCFPPRLRDLPCLHEVEYLQCVLDISRSPPRCPYFPLRLRRFGSDFNCPPLAASGSVCCSAGPCSSTKILDGSGVAGRAAGAGARSNTFCFFAFLTGL